MSVIDVVVMFMPVILPAKREVIAYPSGQLRTNTCMEGKG